MEWPELGLAVRANALDYNKEYFNYFLDNCPLNGVQSHAVVSGKLMYIMNLKLQRFPKERYMDLRKEDLAEMAVGRVGIFVTFGRVGSVMVKYNEITEPMSYPTIAQVRDQDLGTLAKAGAAVWDAMYRTKQIINVVYRAV